MFGYSRFLCSICNINTYIYMYTYYRFYILDSAKFDETARFSNIHDLEFFDDDHVFFYFIKTCIAKRCKQNIYRYIMLPTAKVVAFSKQIPPCLWGKHSGRK